MCTCKSDTCSYRQDHEQELVRSPSLYYQCSRTVGIAVDEGSGKRTHIEWRAITFDQ